MTTHKVMQNKTFYDILQSTKNLDLRDKKLRFKR